MVNEGEKIKIKSLRIRMANQLLHPCALKLHPLVPALKSTLTFNFLARFNESNFDGPYGIVVKHYLHTILSTRKKIKNKERQSERGDIHGSMKHALHVHDHAQKMFHLSFPPCS